MSKDLRPYVIRQGDYMVKLAHRFGFDADEIWNDPKNEEIRAARRDMNVLAPGDIVFVPQELKEGLPLHKGQVNRYRAKVPWVTKRIRFNASAGPLANERFVTEGAQPKEGVSDGEGWVEIKTKITAGTVEITFPEKDLSFTVMMGHMDPITETSGVRSRLRNLGYLFPHPADHLDFPGLEAFGIESEDERLARAINAFQSAQGLAATSAIDDATREALLKAHGG